jgi:DNA polymerase/3'-5' exonuclease PolX
MHLLRANGRFGVVTGWKMVPGTQTMYNLEVAQDHTFTVGDGQWVVHNCGSNLPQVAEARAREISANIGSWSKSYLTVGTAMVEDNGVVRTLIATNEKASSGLVNLVKAQLNQSEELVSLADNQGRHAEQVLVEYAKSNGLKILGLGASNNFCNEICGPMLIKEVGQEFLGQPWPQP